MSAPDLPDIFGNYVLGEDFVEVVSPESIDWLPQTAGWWWLGALLLALLLRFSIRRLRLWYRNRYRREALVKLAALADNSDQGEWLTELNKLLKLTALAGFSRSEVAQLSGDNWVAFLDRQCDPSPFTKEMRLLLGQGIYTGAAPGPETQTALVDACEQWVNNHRSPADV